jgi:hypothetical protein
LRVPTHPHVHGIAWETYRDWSLGAAPLSMQREREREREKGPNRERHIHKHIHT